MIYRIGKTFIINNAGDDIDIYRTFTFGDGWARDLHREFLLKKSKKRVKLGMLNKPLPKGADISNTALYLPEHYIVELLGALGQLAEMERSGRNMDWKIYLPGDEGEPPHADFGVDEVKCARIGAEKQTISYWPGWYEYHSKTERFLIYRALTIEHVAKYAEVQVMGYMDKQYLWDNRKKYKETCTYEGQTWERFSIPFTDLETLN